MIARQTALWGINTHWAMRMLFNLVPDEWLIGHFEVVRAGWSISELASTVTLAGMLRVHRSRIRIQQ